MTFAINKLGKYIITGIVGEGEVIYYIIKCYKVMTALEHYEYILSGLFLPIHIQKGKQTHHN